MSELSAVSTSAATGTPGLWSDSWRDIRRRPAFWFAVAIVGVLLVMAFFPGVFTGALPNDGCLLSNSNGGPGPGHPLGFTRQGCDVWARLVHGASTSLSVGLAVTALTLVIGGVVGAVSGFYGGWIDSVLSRVGDIFFSIPYILAAVVIMSVFSSARSILTISLAIGAFTWPVTARILRAEVIRVRSLDYVLAARAIGATPRAILIRHVLPNAIAPVLVATTLSLAAAIVAEAVLSFLGVGLPPSVMSWGNDISQAQSDLRTAPMVLVYPSLALIVAVLAFVLLGEVLRDSLDPKARARR
jgi:oligopeptide transport system permease protein